MNLKPARTFLQVVQEMAKSFYACNWVPSRITKEGLKGCVITGALPKQSEIHWRVAGLESPPEPKDGEIVVFVDHLSRGFKPPESKKIVTCFLASKSTLKILDLTVSNICNFQVFCEAYLQEEPTVELFRDFFYLSRRTEFTHGPNTELGGVSIQKRKDVSFPHAKHHSHPKDWNQTRFYYNDTSPDNENPLPGYHAHRLTNTHPFPQRLTAKERAKYAPQLAKLRAFVANGLTRIDFVRCWISWGILPLSHHPGLMREYTGDLKDPQRHTNIQLTDAEITEVVKKILDESVAVCSKIGLSPFCVSNKPPAVGIA